MIGLLKLVSGDEIVCDFETDADGFYTVTNPVTLMPVPEGLAMLPFSMVFPQRQLRLSPMHVMYEAEIPTEIFNHYQKKVGGVTIASPQDVPDTAPSSLLLPE